MSRMAKYAQIIWPQPTNDDVLARNHAVETLTADLSQLTTRQAVQAAASIASSFGGAELDRPQEMMLAKAVSMLEAAGLNISEFPVVVVPMLGPAICGAARDGKIFISLLPFRKGTREVAATLLEEFAHLKSGEKDCTRGFQNWLLDQILVNSERFAGEPF